MTTTTTDATARPGQAPQPILSDLLAGISTTAPGLADCLAAATETREMVQGPDALARLPELVGRHLGARSAFIVADGNTMRAAGDRAVAILEAAGIVVVGSYIYPAEPRPHADYAVIPPLVQRLRALPHGAAAPAIIAVGSGTVNDLAKLAAHEAGRPYLCVATAASVDGYTSAGAAILYKGYKRTMECAAPLAIVADTAVLAAAPAWLTSSGFGDLAGKLIAGSDWLVSAAVAALSPGYPGAEGLEPRSWAMVQNGLRAALLASETAWRASETAWRASETAWRASETAWRQAGDALQTLFAGLAVTGFAIQSSRSSRPASGCEHMFSHVWEMADLSHEGQPVTHGHKVAIGTLSAAAFTETLFAPQSPPAPRAVPMPDPVRREAEVRAAFDGWAAVDDTVAIALAKLPTSEAAARLAGAVGVNWTALRRQVLARLPPYAELRAQLARAGCPVSPEQIGLSRDAALATARRAQMIRNRYTVLDLAWDLGLFESTLAAVAADSRYLRA